MAERNERPERPMRPGRKGHRKVCQFCVDKIEYIDYKDVARLRRFMSERAKILPRRVTGHCYQACPPGCSGTLHCRLIVRTKQCKTPDPSGSGVFLCAF